MQAKSRTETFREGRGEFVGDLSPGLDMLPCNLLLPASSYSITNGSNMIGSLPSLACAPRKALKGFLPVRYPASPCYPHFHASAYIPQSNQLLLQSVCPPPVNLHRICTVGNVVSHPLIKGCLVPGCICLPSPLWKEKHWSEHIVEQASFSLEVGDQL